MDSLVAIMRGNVEDLEDIDNTTSCWCFLNKCFLKLIELMDQKYDDDDDI